MYDLLMLFPCVFDQYNICFHIICVNLFVVLCIVSSAMSLYQLYPGVARHNDSHFMSSYYIQPLCYVSYMLSNVDCLLQRCRALPEGIEHSERHRVIRGMNHS